MLYVFDGLGTTSAFEELESSETMVSPDVGSAEDAVRALLDYLVDPLLPAKASCRSVPSLSQHQAVAKQVFSLLVRTFLEFCCFNILPLRFLPEKFWCLLVT